MKEEDVVYVQQVVSSLLTLRLMRHPPRLLRRDIGKVRTLERELDEVAKAFEHAVQVHPLASSDST